MPIRKVAGNRARSKEVAAIAETGRCQLKLWVDPALRAPAKALAKRRRMSLSQLVENLLERALDDEETGGSPDEAAIRDMAILIAVELGLKLQQASIPGGPTLAKRLSESAAQAAIARIEFVETGLRKGGGY